MNKPLASLAHLLAVGMLFSLLAACGGGSAATTASAQSACGVSASAGKDSLVSSSATPKQWSSPPKMELDKSVKCEATLHTTEGDIVINLLSSEDPITVNNFVFLATQGFYNNVPFHRVIVNFMIQTGDPTGTGSGGPGYKFNDEPVTRDYTRGTVAMANSGPNTNGSQFFIVQADMTGRLQKNYTIFGEVTSGMDVVDKIANTPVTANSFGEQSKPTKQILIKSVDVTSK
ncbi:MAG TPA: peptidylprolyl isomerase [Nitrolancea sp.]|jgi:peptidylprolyl isomerase|nr:peptidylprolyl isomerase [Nitrolancea sp.]